jgi:phospholipid transport system transporter-binding protein
MTQAALFEKLGNGQFALSGDLVFESAPRLLLEGEAEFGAAGRAEIDLGRVGRIDSAGLALLLEWSIAARSAGRSVAYRNMPAGLAALAGISDVSELLPATASGAG